MARQLRVEYEGSVYHVTARANSGGDLSVDDGDREYWIYRAGESAAEHRVKFLFYCLMANQFHLVVETPRGRLGRFMQSLLTGHTVRLLFSQAVTEAIWSAPNRDVAALDFG
jgi:REP element-mobilizing transposase RayT